MKVTLLASAVLLLSMFGSIHGQEFDTAPYSRLKRLQTAMTFSSFPLPSDDSVQTWKQESDSSGFATEFPSKLVSELRLHDIVKFYGGDAMDCDLANIVIISEKGRSIRFANFDRDADVAIQPGQVVAFLAPMQEVEAKSYPVLSGVGLALYTKDGHVYVAKVLPNSPADKSGMITTGAQLVSIEVDGTTSSFDGKSIGEATNLIRGPVGTEIVLRVVPSGDDAVVEVRLVRAPLEIAGVPEANYNGFIGKPMPQMNLTSLDGTQSSQLSDYHGKVVVLDFWASWCPTCYPPVAKLQDILANNPHWKEKVEVIAVTVDSDIAEAVAVIEEQKWKNTLNCALDFDELNSIGVTVVPLVMVVAPDGTIANMAGAHAIEIEKEVDSLLAK
jgi:thiol-disulfide isomerase/thioredoxin